MAGSKKDSFENSLLQLIFNNVDIANIGDAAGLQNSVAAGNLYVALYSTAPSDSAAGTEITYTGYARVAVARTTGGWTVSANNASNTAAVTFGACSSGTPTAYAFAICKAGTRDVDDAIYWGDLTSSLAISAGITPEFAIGDIDINED
jgi:hypothetical protein